MLLVFVKMCLTGQSFSFTIVVLLASLCSLISSENMNITYLSTSNTKRNIATEAVINVLSGMTKFNDISLQFLYGSEYEEAVHTLAELVSKQFIGQTRLENDKRIETLQQLLLPSSRPVLLVVLESPVNIVNIFQKIRMKMLNSHLVKWLLVMEEESGDNRIVEIEDFVNEGTHVTICKINPEGYCDLLFPYIDNKGVTRFTGKTAIGDKQRNKKNRPKYYSLSGREMKVATKELTMFARLGRTLPDGSVEADSGFGVNVLKALSIKLNFTYRAYIPEDNQWGNLQSDGSVTGIIGMIARREVTFGFSGLILSESRESVIDFAYYNIGGSTILLSRSPKEKNKALAILSPFDIKVWVLISMAVLFMGPVAYLLSYRLNKAEDFKADLIWYEFNMFGSIVNQGILIKESSAPLRLILIFWLLFCVICTATYKGMLTAMFALPAYETPVDSLEDLPGAVRDGFTIGTLESSSYMQFFKTSPDGIFKQTWNLFDHEDPSKSFVGSAIEGAKRVLNGKFIFIISDLLSRYLLRILGIENFHMSRESFNPLTSGFACHPGSPVKDTLFYGILRLEQAGILFKWLDDEFNKIPLSQSTDDEGKTSSVINLTHLQAAFYLLFLGMLIASAALIMETVIFKK